MASPISSRHVVIVDDDPDMRAAFRVVLEDEGHRVTLFAKAGPDVAVFADVEPDSLIIDSHGITVDGPEVFLHQLRAHPRLATVPIILCTGAVADVETMEPVLTALQVAVLLKPFDIDQLLAAVLSPPAVAL